MTRDTETVEGGTGGGMWECGKWEIQWTWESFTRIQKNVLDDSRECHHFNFMGNVQKDSEESWRRFRRIFEKIPQNVVKDSREMLLKILRNVLEHYGECCQRFRVMLIKILGNAIKDSEECSRWFREM